jgi:hypothetical protein
MGCARGACVVVLCVMGSCYDTLAPQPLGQLKGSRAPPVGARCEGGLKLKLLS